MNTYTRGPIKKGDETYFESAGALVINRERAILELKRHGLTAREHIEQFDKHFGAVTEYQAQAVLRWLGY